MDKEILMALEDSEFAEKILDCISPEEVQEYFEEAGIYVTEEDVNKILCSVYGVAEESALTNDYDLTLVAGGNSGGKVCVTENVDKDVIKALESSVGVECLAQKLAENKANNPIAIRYGAPKIEKTNE